LIISKLWGNKKFQFIVGKDTLANIITCRTNEYITKNIIKILLQEGEGINVFGFNPQNRRNRKEPWWMSLNLKSISHSGIWIYSNYLQILWILGGMGIVETSNIFYFYFFKFYLLKIYYNILYRKIRKIK
jgi:hypothetical protein